MSVCVPLGSSDPLLAEGSECVWEGTETKPSPCLRAKKQVGEAPHHC